MAKRAYKTTRLKVLEGNRSRKKNLGQGEPQPRPVEPQCPADLDAEARRVWNEIAPRLERLGLLTENDGDMLAVLCQIRSRLAAIHGFIRDGNASLVQERVTIDGAGVEHIEIKASPYAVMEKQYYQIFRMYAREFGMSPLGRSGLVVDSGDSMPGAELLTPED